MGHIRIFLKLVEMFLLKPLLFLILLISQQKRMAWWTFPNVDKPVANSTPGSTTSTTQRIHGLTVHRGARLTLDSVYAHGVHADGCHSTLGDDGAVITYIHLSSRCRQNAVAKRLAAHQSARVVDASTEKVLAATAEFRTLVQHLNGQNKASISMFSRMG